MEVIKTGLISVLIIIAPIYIFSILFSAVEKYNSRLIMSMFGYRGIVVTGAIGTVIHEFSHMLMCVIFGHNIVEFSMFRPIKGSYDGVMGYVNHSYNKKNLYQNIGNFFIGVAPIIFGIVFLILFMWVLLPQEFNSVKSNFNRNMIYFENVRGFKDTINIYVSMIISLFEVLNPFKQTNIIRYLIYLFVMYSISTHMDLSKEDLKNSKTGSVLFFSLLFIGFISLKLLNIDIYFYALKISVSIMAFLSLGLIFSMITYTITKIIDIFIM